MTTQDCPNPEMLSALFDGQAGSEKVLGDLSEVSMQNMHSDWRCYQMIGDTLRSSSYASILGADPAFLQRIRAGLVGEVMDEPLKPLAAAAQGAVATPSIAAANDHQFRWKLVAGFASLGAVAAVAWSMSGAFLGPPGSQLAQTTGVVQTLVTASPEGPMIRDPRLEELLSAHKQLGGTSLQVPSGFVRNAGFEASRQSGR